LTSVVKFSFVTAPRTDAAPTTGCDFRQINIAKASTMKLYKEHKKKSGKSHAPRNGRLLDGGNVQYCIAVNKGRLSQNENDQVGKKKSTRQQGLRNFLYILLAKFLNLIADQVRTHSLTWAFGVTRLT
jgi:hypothetical protein